MLDIYAIKELNDGLEPELQIKYATSDELGLNSLSMGALQVDLKSFKFEYNYAVHLERINNLLPLPLKLSFVKNGSVLELWIGFHNTRKGLDEGRLRDNSRSFIEQVNLYLFPRDQFQIKEKDDKFLRVTLFNQITLERDEEDDLVLNLKEPFISPIEEVNSYLDKPILNKILPRNTSNPQQILPLNITTTSGLSSFKERLTKNVEKLIEDTLNSTEIKGLELNISEYTPLTKKRKEFLTKTAREAFQSSLPLELQEEFKEYWPSNSNPPLTPLPPNILNYISIPPNQSPQPINLNNREQNSAGFNINSIRGFIESGANFIESKLEKGERLLGYVNPERWMEMGLNKLNLTLPSFLRDVISIDAKGINFNLDNAVNRLVSQANQFIPPPLRNVLKVGMKNGKLDIDINQSQILNFGVNKINSLLPSGLGINIEAGENGVPTAINLGPFRINLSTGEMILNKRVLGIDIIERLMGGVLSPKVAPRVTLEPRLTLDVLDGAELNLDPKIGSLLGISMNGAAPSEVRFSESTIRPPLPLSSPSSSSKPPSTSSWSNSLPRPVLPTQTQNVPTSAPSSVKMSDLPPASSTTIPIPISRPRRIRMSDLPPPPSN